MVLTKVFKRRNMANNRFLNKMFAIVVVWFRVSWRRPRSHFAISSTLQCEIVAGSLSFHTLTSCANSTRTSNPAKVLLRTNRIKQVVGWCRNLVAHRTRIHSRNSKRRWRKGQWHLLFKEDALPRRCPVQSPSPAPMQVCSSPCTKWYEITMDFGLLSVALVTDDDMYLLHSCTSSINHGMTSKVWNYQSY